MATPVEVPKLGNSVEECLITRWVKQPGDKVAAGDLVAEIETDKATFEVTSPVDGTVLAAFFPEGALVPVFTNLFVIGAPGESVDAFRPGTAAPAAAAEPAAVAAAPAAAAVEARAAVVSAPLTGAYSPRARRFAEEHHFTPSGVRGSGPSGRILEEDVRRVFYNGPDVVVAAAIPLPTPAPTPAAPRTTGGIRDKIARRMRESLATTAQYTLSASADATGLLKVRARIKAAGGEANINDLVMFCTIQALLQAPALNALYIDGKIEAHTEVHLGFACDTPRGLLVPVIRDAHKLSIADLARQSKDLAGRAVESKISPDDLAGATFTISNLGGLGIESFTPLLNPPQVGILGVGAIQLKPVRKDGQVEFVDSIGLSLTCDHQVIDGAPGARFLQVVREKIANVESICTI